MSPTSESRALTSKNICILLCIHHCTCWHGRLRGRIDRLRGRIGAVVEIRNYDVPKDDGAGGPSPERSSPLDCRSDDIVMAI